MTAPKQMIREKNRKSNNQPVAAVEVQQYLQCWQRGVVSGERVHAMQVVMEGDIQEVVEVLSASQCCSIVQRVVVTGAAIAS